MTNFAIITDSSCDLPAYLVEEMDLNVVPLAFLMDGKTYLNYPDNREMNPKEFYAKLSAGSMPTTNAVNVGQATDAMEPYLKAGKDVLVLAFSSALSTTCNSFQIAADDLKEQYPDRKIYVIDTLAASLGQGMLVYQAAKLRMQDKTIEEVCDWVEENKAKQCHWLTVNDLFHLKRGGRVSATTAVLGTMLQIKPVLHVTDEGKLVSVDKARGRRAALNALVERVEETAIEPGEQTMFISYSACREDAQYVADEIKARCGTQEIILNDIGPVIGSHTGLGCVALFFTGTPR